MLDSEDFEELDDFDLAFEEEDDMPYFGSKGARGQKVRHCSGIEGVILSHNQGYYWIGHSGGVESFIHSGELSYEEGRDSNEATKEELEIYLGHKNGLSSQEASTASV